MTTMAPSVADIVRLRASALSLAASTVTEAERRIQSAGTLGADACARLRREWLNDLVADLSDDHFEVAARDADAHFLAWLDTRLRKPFHVTYRAVDRVARTCGSEAAIRLVNITWPREIALAQRLRRDENPRVAVLSALFLRECLSDPGGMFRRVAEEWEDATTRDPVAARAPCEMSPEEIRASAENPPWTPLFLRLADRAYRDTVDGMSRSRLEALAERAANEETRDIARLTSARAAFHARRAPMARMPEVARHACALELDSNAVCEAETEFLSALEAGQKVVAPGTVVPWREFLDALTDSPGRIASAPTVEAEAARIAQVSLLGKSWIDRLPAEYARLGARKKETFEEWKSSVVSGERPAPTDPVADYGFHLVSKRRRSNSRIGR